MDVKIGDVVELTAGSRRMTVTHCQISDDTGDAGADRIDCAELAATPTADPQPQVCTIWLSAEGAVTTHCFDVETIRRVPTPKDRSGTKVGF